MPRVTRCIAEVNAVRNRILDCAFGVLAEHGYEGLSMSRIGNKMRMTAANLYNYFANKDELLIAIHKKAHAMLYDELKDAVAGADTPRGRYEGLTKAFVSFATQNVHLYDIMFNRPIKQHSDYIGTPQEKLSYDEFQSSLKVARLMVDVVLCYRKTQKDVQPKDKKYLTLQYMSTLHGIISLKNSGVLKQLYADPEAALQNVIKRTTDVVSGKYNGLTTRL